MVGTRQNNCRKILLWCHIRISEKHTEEYNNDGSSDDGNNNNNSDNNK